MAERGRNRTFYNRFAIDSSSCVLRHGRGSISCEQNLHGRFQANRLAAFVKSNFAIPPAGRHLSPNQGLAGGQIAPQRRLCWSRDHVDSPVASSRLATDFRLLPPRSGLERSDFVPWPIVSATLAARRVRFQGYTFHAGAKAARRLLSQSGEPISYYEQHGVLLTKRFR
jgi:hypothetical protein